MSRPSSAGSTQQIPLQTLRSRFREAWTTHADPKGRVFSHGLISMLQQLNCFQTTINVGKREAPRYITFNAVPNDVMFLLKSLGYSDHEVAIGVYLEYPIMEKWYINQSLGFQGQRLNVLLTRHTLSKPRMGYHKLPPGNVLFGNITKQTGLNIKDLVEGNFAKPAEKQALPKNWPPRKPGLAGDDGAVHGDSSTFKKKDDLWMLMTYGYGPIMGKGVEHNYAPAENTRRHHGLPVPRNTLSSSLKAQVAVNGIESVRPPRPSSAKYNPSWKLAEFTDHATARTRLDGYPLDYENRFPDRVIPSMTARSSGSTTTHMTSGGGGGGGGQSRQQQPQQGIRMMRPQSARA